MPGKYTITINKGEDVDLNLTYKDGAGNPVDLTGYTAAFQIRKNPTADAALVNLTHLAGITLGGVLGTIRIQINNDVTSALEIDSGHYALEIDSGTKVTRLLEGLVICTPEVVR